MKSCWLQNCKTEDQKKDMRVALASGRPAFERLQEILKQRLSASYDQQRSKTNYDDSNWAVKQADFIGCQRTYKEILDIISDIK